MYGAALRGPVQLALMLCILVLGCGQAQDDCQRAFARLARLDAAQSRPSLPGRHADEALAACRAAGRTVRLDPVVLCAMESTTDDAAARCIDQFVKAVIVPTDARSDGSGINPLLQP